MSHELSFIIILSEYHPTNRLPHSYTMGSTYIIPACVIICKRKCVSTNIHFLMSPERVDHLIASAIDMNN